MEDADFVRFRGTKEEALATAPAILGLKGLSPVTKVPMQDLLRHALREELYQQILRAVARNGALDDVSTALPQPRLTRFLSSQHVLAEDNARVQRYTFDSRPNGAEGWPSRSRRETWSAWNADGRTLQRAQYQPFAPEQEDARCQVKAT